MSKKYSREKTIEEFQKAMNNDIAAIYNANCIKWREETKGENAELYSEIIAEKLLKNDIVNKILQIESKDREESYRVGHDGETKNQTNRKEEIFAKELFKYCNSDNKPKLNDIGRIFDYQVPLKASQNDEAGKIDLVSHNKSEKIVYLLELKHKANKETLLRCALEIATYYQLLNKDKFINDYSNYELKNSDMKDKDIKKGILIFKDSSQHNEIKSGLGPRLKELLDSLKVEIFLVDYIPEVKPIFP